MEVGVLEMNDEISAPRLRLCHNFVERMWSRGLEEQKGFATFALPYRETRLR